MFFDACRIARRKCGETRILAALISPVPIRKSFSQNSEWSNFAQIQIALHLRVPNLRNDFRSRSLRLSVVHFPRG